MKCPMCDGMGTSNVCVNGTFKTCAYCNWKGEVENLCDTCGTICPFEDEHSECEVYSPQTNEGWLKSLNTDEFADFLEGVAFDSNFRNGIEAEYRREDKDYCYGDRPKIIRAWLKAVHKK